MAAATGLRSTAQNTPLFQSASKWQESGMQAFIRDEHRKHLLKGSSINI